MRSHQRRLGTYTGEEQLRYLRIDVRGSRQTDLTDYESNGETQS